MSFKREAVVPVIAEAQHRLMTKDDLEIALSPLKIDLAVLKWMIGIQLQGACPKLLRPFLHNHHTLKTTGFVLDCSA